MGLEVEVRQHGRFYVIRCVGEADLSTVPPFKAAAVELLDAKHYDILVDFSETWFVDSTALSVLVFIRKDVFKHFGEMRLVVQPHTLQIIEITGLDRLFDVFLDLELALDRP